MSDQAQPKYSTPSTAESLVSLAFCLGVAAALFFAWSTAGRMAYLVAAIGYLIVSPVWYRAPISFKALRHPFRSDFTHRREMRILHTLLTFIGYGLVFVGVGLFVFA